MSLWTWIGTGCLLQLNQRPAVPVLYKQVNQVSGTLGPLTAHANRSYLRVNHVPITDTWLGFIFQNRLFGCVKMEHWNSDVTSHSQKPAHPTINCSTQLSASVPPINTTSIVNGVMSMLTYRQTINASIHLIGTQISCAVYVDWPPIIDQSEQCNNSSPSHVFTWTSQIISLAGSSG